MIESPPIQDVIERLRGGSDEDTLKALLTDAVDCPDLQSFRARRQS